MNTTPTIKQLRQSGYKIRVMHIRDMISIRKLSGLSQTFSNFGGKTKIEVTSPEGSTSTGESICSSKENYNRRIGNEIALGRALASLK